MYAWDCSAKVRWNKTGHVLTVGNLGDMHKGIQYTIIFPFVPLQIFHNEIPFLELLLDSDLG